MPRKAKNNRLSVDDQKVWRAVTKTVSPIVPAADVESLGTEALPAPGHRKPRASANPELNPDKAQKRKAAQTRASRDELLDLVSQNSSANALRDALTPKLTHAKGPSLVPGATKDIDRRTATRLRQGRLPIEARLDLHGMTQDRAFQAVGRFIQSSALEGRRCVILITGKGLGQSGGGALRNQAPQWLNLPENRKYIVSMTYAQPKDGGTGALYIYLKRPHRIAGRPQKSP